MVKELERNFELPQTGVLVTFLNNYCQKYYTRQYQSYGHGLRFCLNGAGRRGHRDIVKLMRESGASDY